MRCVRLVARPPVSFPGALNHMWTPCCCLSVHQAGATLCLSCDLAQLWSVGNRMPIVRGIKSSVVDCNQLPGTSLRSAAYALLSASACWPRGLYNTLTLSTLNLLRTVLTSLRFSVVPGLRPAAGHAAALSGACAARCERCGGGAPAVRGRGPEAARVPRRQRGAATGGAAPTKRRAGLAEGTHIGAPAYKQENLVRTPVRPV